MSGKLLFWFGAGISVPSGMPGGQQLTAKWLQHHLPTGENRRILELFERHRAIIGKSLPRLEKVIEDAVWCFGPRCLENLAFFRDCRPNQMHRMIAEYVKAKRAFAVTTNFDEALERCDPDIPVSTPATGLTADWGLLKIHGSIGEDLTTLGHSISMLQNGIAPSLRSAILAEMNDPETTVVFVGYSGSDFFDVLPLFEQRNRADETFAAKVIWLHYHPHHDIHLNWTDEDWSAVLTRGQDRMLAAFDPDRKQCRAGLSHRHIAEVLGLGNLPLDISVPPEGDGWDKGWETRFQPNDDAKRRYTAKLSASLGLGTAGCRIPIEGLPRDRFTQDHQLAFNAFRDAGFYDAEHRLRQWALNHPSDTYGMLFHRRQMAAAARLANRWIEAWRQYRSLLDDVRRKNDADRREVLWSAAEAGIFAESAIMSLRAKANAARIAILPLELALRAMILDALDRLVNTAADGPEANDPHLKEAIARLAAHIVEYPGGLIAWVERRRWPDGLPVPAFIDDTGHHFLETDSLLGVVNKRRSHAWRHMVFHRPLDADDRKAVAADLHRSGLLARAIGDPMGQLKAWRSLSWLSFRQGCWRRCFWYLGLWLSVRIRLASLRATANRRAARWLSEPP